MAEIKISWWMILGAGVIVYFVYRHFNKKNERKAERDIAAIQQAIIDKQRAENPTGEVERQILAVGHLPVELDLARGMQRNYINNSGVYLGGSVKNMFWRFMGSEEDPSGRGGATF